MAPPKQTTLRFVDSHPFPASKREQELIRADARSHAATVSHPKNRKQTAEEVDGEDLNSAEQPPLPDRSLNEQQATFLATTATTVSILSASTSSARQTTKAWQKFNQKNQPFHRYRVHAPVLGKGKSREANIGRKRKEGERVEHGSQVVTARTSIPLYKGNTDPFETTIVPVSALEHLLLQQARAQSMQNTWPSEIALRNNHRALTAESLQKIPAFISDKAASHALLSHSYYSSSSRQRIHGQPYEESLVLAQKHKFQSLRSLQEAIEEQGKTRNPLQLRRIYHASAWLSAAEMLSGNIQAAMVHLKACKKIIDAMGGWSVIPRMEKEIILGATVNLAAGLRGRPAMDIGDFDPGPWNARHLSPAWQSSPELYADAKFVFPEVAQVPAITSNNIAPRLRAIIEDMNELLLVEELKFKYATSIGAAQLFRWSHSRKVSIRARALNYWCDLNEAAKRDDQPMLNLLVPVRLGIVLPSPLTISYEFALCAAMRTFDRCIFEEHYQPAGVFREGKRYHIELSALMEALRPPAQDFSLTTDEHTNDALWIYSVGAYVEDVFLRPHLARADDPTPRRESFFTMRFSYLVATNLDFGSFEDVTNLLRERYLYYPRLQDASLRKLIEL